ncbi:LacI family DNA-binding transcriptional regulator [Streptomyces sp. NPDC057690]|uniref:LacI family DNA-binding transcriptional regulator n=1 Tax=Streptomyces sp. NPDC057690 TaxID=3346214 RepID=UPI00369E0480
MTRSAKRTTSADVARAAGVSRTTVSYVLNNRPGEAIPEETRRRVTEAARRLQYRPHAGARALAAGRTDIVLLAIPDLPMSPSLSRYVEELTSALADHGLTLVIHLMRTDDRALTDVCAAVGASAVLGFRTFDADTVEALHGVGATVVLPTAGHSPTVARLGRAQAQHLIARGHHRLGYLMPAQQNIADIAQERLRGVSDACAEAGVAPPDSRASDMEVDALAPVAANWAEQGITAVCAYNDEYAMALLAAMHRIGLRAPDDLAVVGADDIPVARFAQPALSTVYVDLRQAGRQRAETVAAGLRRRQVAQAPPLDDVRLVVRDSS